MNDIDDKNYIKTHIDEVYNLLKNRIPEFISKMEFSVFHLLNVGSEDVSQISIEQYETISYVLDLSPAEVMEIVKKLYQKKLLINVDGKICPRLPISI